MGTKNNFDIEKMAKETGIPVAEIQANLGMPVQVSTIEEAREIVRRLPGWFDARKQVRKQWDAIALKELESVKTAKEAQELYKNLHVLSHVRKQVYEKWDAIARKELENVKTAKEAQELNKHTLFLSDLQKQVYEKWRTIAFKELESVKSAKEAQELYENAPASLKRKAWNKLASFYGFKNQPVL